MKSGNPSVQVSSFTLVSTCSRFKLFSMEMDSDHLNDDGNSLEETSLKQCPPDSTDISNLFGDRQVNPRIGDEFQAEILPMITGTEYIQLLMNPTDSNVMFDVSHSYLMGLPIPMMWLHEVNEIEDQGGKVLGNSDDTAGADESSKYKKRKRNQIIIGKKGSKLNASDSYSRLNNGKASKPDNFEAKIAGITNSDICTSYSPVPGLRGDTWRDAEKDIFLLGLYIFGKNFFLIKRFIETKEMGDILSFYYGLFYRSKEYRRWSDCRKPRSRKCVYGRKIFTGWRQQELLSRLLPCVPEESHNPFLEVSKSFAEGRTSLESYVSYLKATVGTFSLVESVGIGKGKEDLTSLAMEPVRTNQWFPVCPTMPSAKACSSLTSSDIIKFLTGGFRLSKARCNDIFWEAVWPRLLARGWHSEQPKNHGYVSSKDYLVFLMPGVKKFSRRKLVKGDHYFDSVSDILNKVASEPKLLELEAEEAKVSSCTEEDRWVPEELSDQDDPSNQRPHCYLKPRTSNCNSENMKFMVVDSSLLYGGKSSKVRELRFLPVDFKDNSKLIRLSNENKGCFFENFLDKDKPDVANIPLNEQKSITISKKSKHIFDTSGSDSLKFMVVDTSSVHGGKSSEVRSMRYCPVESKVSSNMNCLTRVDEGNSSNGSVDEHKLNAASTLLNSEPDASDSLLNKNVDISSDTIVAFGSNNSNEKAVNSGSARKMEMCQDQKAKSDDKKSKRIIKHHFSRRSKYGNTNSLAPIVKRRRLTACAKTETNRIAENFSVDLGSKALGPCSALDLSDVGYNDMGPSLEKISSSCSSVRITEEESNRCIFKQSCFSMEMSRGKNENLQIPLSIDLNLSQAPLDSENGELLMMDVEDSQCMNSNGSFFHANKLDLETLKTSAEVGAAEQQPNLQPRRQSTRNRPLTAKALEALACGFLNISKKEKGKESPTKGIPFSNPSRRARSRMKVSSKHSCAGTGIVDLEEKKEVNETFVVNKDIACKPLNQFEEKSLNIY